MHQFGSYDLFQNAATPHDRKWLIIGPAEYDLPCMHWQLEALAFFDHLIFGAENGYAPLTRMHTTIDAANHTPSLTTNAA